MRAGFPIFGALAMLAATALSSAAHAQRAPEQPWCASSRGHDMSFSVCGFQTLEACRQEILGLGGHCYRNPYYKPPERRSQRQREQR
jgi:hypothetical protein